METQQLTSQLTDKEMINRIIGRYICSISKGDNGELIEKTYENINGGLVYVTKNIIPRGHPRYEKLNGKLDKK